MARKRKYSATEYTIDALPKNRKEVFWDVFKLRFKTLLFLGLITFVFTIPMQIAAYLKEITLSSIYADFTNGLVTSEEATTAISTMTNQFSLLGIIFWVIFAVGIAGVMQVIKRLAWAESIVLSNDFAQGIKQNTKQYMLLFLIVGVLSFISSVIATYGSFVEIGTIYSYLGMIPKVVFLVIFLPIGMHALTNILIYNNKFNHQIRLSLFVYFSNLLKTIGVVLALSLTFLILLIPNFYVHMIGRVVVAFQLPFLLLKWFLVSSDMLDQKWNVRHYPELINKGVLGAKKEENDEETSD